MGAFVHLGAPMNNENEQMNAVAVLGVAQSLTSAEGPRWAHQIGRCCLCLGCIPSKYERPFTNSPNIPIRQYTNILIPIVTGKGIRRGIPNDTAHNKPQFETEHPKSKTNYGAGPLSTVCLLPSAVLRVHMLHRIRIHGLKLPTSLSVVDVPTATAAGGL